MYCHQKRGCRPDRALTARSDIAGYSGAPSPPDTENVKELEAVVRAMDCEQAARSARSIAAGWSQAGERSPEVLPDLRCHGRLRIVGGAL
jgi:hypothetical protein